MAEDDEKWIKRALNRPERDAELMRKGPQVPLHPLTGWSTATLPKDAVTLVLEFLTTPPEISARILRLAMTRPQCAELSAALDRLARTPHVALPEQPS